MELTAQWTMPVGAAWPLEFKWKLGSDDLPTGVHIDSATKTVTPAAGLTVTNPVVNATVDGVTFTATAVTAGSYSVLIVATRSDGMFNVALGHINVVAASSRTSLASNALVTLADFRGYVNDESVNANVAESIINGVSQEFDRFVGRVLKQAAHTNLYLDGTGSKYLELPSWPAATVTGVYEDDVLLVVDTDYKVYTSDDDAYLLKYQTTWPELDLACPVWHRGYKNIKISSVSLGYATIPGDLVLACLKQCATEYMRRQKSEWGQTSRSAGEGGSVSLIEPGLLKDVEAVLKRYRRVSL